MSKLPAPDVNRKPSLFFVRFPMRSHLHTAQFAKSTGKRRRAPSLVPLPPLTTLGSCSRPRGGKVGSAPMPHDAEGCDAGRPQRATINQGTTAARRAGARYGQAPAVLTPWPCDAASHSLLYVFPSQPQTGE